MVLVLQPEVSRPGKHTVSKSHGACLDIGKGVAFCLEGGKMKKQGTKFRLVNKYKGASAVASGSIHVF